MKWLDKLERKFGKYYIHNLITIIVAMNAIIYLLYYLSGGAANVSNLALIPQKVMQGEVWRLITFIFIPPKSSPLFIFFTLYFAYLAGKGLENAWGGFKFNVYYFCGVLVTIIVSLLTGTSADASYLNLSIFLAFAMLYPDMEVLLFFLIPIKIKYIAYFDFAIIAISIIKAI